MKLDIPRCPHCGISKPNLSAVWATRTSQVKPVTHVYECQDCSNLVMVRSLPGMADQIWPAAFTADLSIPQRARQFLDQAAGSIHTPAGSVMLTASAVDAMLKALNLKEGSLNTRIKLAAESHLITKEMADWAHEVRLEANDQRHSDEAGPLPSDVDARRSLAFATALGEFLFVLPSRVKAGRAVVGTSPNDKQESKAISVATKPMPH